MAYEFTNKFIQREAIVIMYGRCVVKGDVVFLDDKHAGACNAYLKTGIPKEHLKPVNSSSEYCDDIKHLSGVLCSCSDIDDYIAGLDDNSCSVIWLDYTKTDVTPETITRMGAMVQKRTIEKRSLHSSAEFRTNDRVVVEWRGGIHLTAVVLDSTPPHRVEVVLDCDGETRWMTASKVSLNPDTHSTHTLDAMEGRTIHMPFKIWGEGDMKAYKGVKRCGKHLLFQICKRMKGSDRYASAAINESSVKNDEGRGEVDADVRPGGLSCEVSVRIDVCIPLFFDGG